MTTAAATDLTILDNIRIAAPCSADWGQMTGDERSRLCGQCAKHVYDFSELSAEAAVALILQQEGNLCGRLYRRADGTVITSDCPVGVRAVVWRTRRLFAACLSAIVVGCMLLVMPSVLARGSTRPRSVVARQVTLWVDDVLIWIGVRRPRPVMGDLCYEPPASPLSDSSIPPAPPMAEPLTIPAADSSASSISQP